VPIARDDPAPSTRPGRLPRAWAYSTRPGDTAFGGTGGSVFDRLNELPQRARQLRSPFDICHAGVVLRAILVMQAIVAVGVAFGAASFAQWLLRYSIGAGVALSGTLLWLMSACALHRVLARAGEVAQVGAAALLGAACGIAGWLLFALVSADRWTPVLLLAPAIAGAAFGAATTHWLRLRSRSALPADTTARLAELQSRIRPHFLFNTLNTAMALVRVDPQRAEDMLADLSELFRVALAPGHEAVALADEIDLAQRYLAIEQARFGERLAVDWDLDDAAARARVPPLLLQPLLENAVRHGIEPSPEGGSIRVRSRVRRGAVVLTIVNTVSSQPSQPGHGIALRNVRERLRLMHDVAAQFDARRHGDLFRVQILLPQ
jgi:two-component system sensor histidine kinase AlgZ